jgi:hypothetical protein
MANFKEASPLEFDYRLRKTVESLFMAAGNPTEIRIGDTSNKSFTVTGTRSILIGRDNLGYTDIDGRIMSKRMFKIYFMRVWTD